MSVPKRKIPRAKMSPQERRFRSALAKLISERGVLRGTLVHRERKCGKRNCKCTRGEKHKGVYLVVSEDGRRRQLHIPKDWEETVEQWVADYGEIRELLERVSRLHWDKVVQRRS